MLYQSRYEGRVAIVTGAASGIGRAVAARLIAEGAKVSVWDRDESSLSQTATELGAANQVVVDVTDFEQVSHATDRAASALGKIDILVGSAGITGPNATLWEYPVEAWQQVIDVNLNGLFYCNRAVAPHLQRNDMAGL